MNLIKLGNLFLMMFLLVCFSSCVTENNTENPSYISGQSKKETPQDNSVNASTTSVYERTFEIRDVETQHILFGAEKYPYSEKEEQFVRGFIKVLYGACRDEWQITDPSIEPPAGTIISVSKPFIYRIEKSDGSLDQYPESFLCVFIADGHVIGHFSILYFNERQAFSASYTEVMEDSLNKRIGSKEAAKIKLVSPPDGTAPYAEVYDIAGEDNESGIWFSFVVEQ